MIRQLQLNYAWDGVYDRGKLLSAYVYWEGNKESTYISTLDPLGLEWAVVASKGMTAKWPKVTLNGVDGYRFVATRCDLCGHAWHDGHLCPSAVYRESIAAFMGYEYTPNELDRGMDDYYSYLDGCNRELLKVAVYERGCH